MKLITKSMSYINILNNLINKKKSKIMSNCYMNKHPCFNLKLQVVYDKSFVAQLKFYDIFNRNVKDSKHSTSFVNMKLS